MMLNDRQIKLTESPQAGRLSLNDGNGLSLRVSTSNRSWSLQYRFNGRKMRMTLGSYPTLSLKQARILAQEKRVALLKGIDPQEDKKQRKEYTFGYYVELYIVRHVSVNLKSHKEVTRIFNTYLLPKIGKISLKSIQKQQVLRIIDTLVNTNRGVTANRVLQHLKTMFKWCIQRGYIDHSIVESIGKPYKEQSRDRVLSVQEIKLIYDSCAVLTNIQRVFVQFLILSGQRLNEIAQLRWIDIREDCLEIPKNRSKNNKKIITPLTETMHLLLKTLPKEGEYIFSTTSGIKPLNCFAYLKRKIIQKSGVNEWTFHDFRRSMATFLGDKGYEYHNIMLVLNHSDHSVTSIYNRSSQFKKKYETLTFWNDNFNNKLHFNKAYSGGVGPSYLKG